MRIDILTLFPDMCRSVYEESIIGRAKNKGILEIFSHNIRDFSTDKHRRVDDTPYGGGMGMLMQAQPIYDCYKYVCEQTGKKPYVIYLSPQGKVFSQDKAKELAHYENLILLCGHYEGIDERVLSEIVDEEISIGDYVLTGGELPALVVTDAVGRMIDGVLPNEEAFSCESIYNGLLEHPQYTKPYEWNGKTVPEVLISGHHANIEKWKREQSLRVTFNKRPELLETAELTNNDRKILDKIKNE
ncbi:MAG: tRNA (guanosine(37)-N1)-methyltransferase TrmD [Ruminococcaceae bacterium]|nr:tRNA (guanosine(37)-N1)-methyltransferase TrmD [Oscillospiraceae bacterium]